MNEKLLKALLKEICLQIYAKDSPFDPSLPGNWLDNMRTQIDKVFDPPTTNEKE